MTKNKDRILQEARRITKWNKKRLNRKARQQKQLPSGKGGYRKTGFDSRMHTMA